MRTDRSSLPGLVDVIFRNPVITVTSVMRALHIAQPTASNAIKRAVELGWLDSRGRWGRGGKERWLAREIWRAVASDIDKEAP